MLTKEELVKIGVNVDNLTYPNGEMNVIVQCFGFSEEDIENNERTELSPDIYHPRKNSVWSCSYNGDNIPFANKEEKEDVLNHILNAVDNLKEFYSKRGISFIWGLNTYMELIGETKKYQRIYDIKTFELALILHCISCLRQIDLHKLNCLVYNIDYRVYRVKLETSKEAMTYKECQKHFFKSFSDMLSGQSYDERWWIKNLKSIR